MTIHEKQKQEIAAIDREIRQTKGALSYALTLHEKLPLIQRARDLNKKRLATRRQHILENFKD